MSIHDTTDVLLSDLGRTATWLALADKYMQAYSEDPKHFVLPRSHALIKPLIEAYAHHLEGFVTYVGGIRDSIPTNTLAYRDVQILFRRINGRYTQQVRRERAARAIAQAEKLYGKTDFHTRQKWIADLEHEWAGRRLAFLDDASRGKRMSMDERSEFLAEFWDVIDTEVNNGEGLPPWN
jgi:hypothetical protein